MKRFLSLLLCMLMMVSLIPAAPALAASGVAINERNFPDDTFRKYVSENLDGNQNGYLSTKELGAKQIDIPADYNTIRSLKGIELFYALETLKCSSISNLTELDLSQNIELKSLDCSYDCSLSKLNVSGNAKLESLSCSNAALTKLDVSHNPALKILICFENSSLTELDVSKNPELESLGVTGTGLTELDVSHNPSLKKLVCMNTGIIALDLSNCPLLVETIEKGNHDVSPNTEHWTYYGEGESYWIFVPAGSALILYHKPVISTQPTSVTASAGSTAAFTVQADGAKSFQWYYRKTPTGAWNKCTNGTDATLTVEAKTYRNGYQYRCRVSNPGGYKYSSAATLTVLTKPTITTQPTDQSGSAGTTVNFTVKADGAETYQWYYRTSSTGTWKKCTGTGAATATLTVEAKSYRNGYQYRCKVSNAVGYKYSSIVTLTVK
ncbi:MAG: immunoglobulin domain-containing protein [Oscillospiraceae bacterium]|nr:immunoglobulin domain-containing protein [Oscillospiraceae bacterium]